MITNLFKGSINISSFTENFNVNGFPALDKKVINFNN